MSGINEDVEWPPPVRSADVEMTFGAHGPESTGTGKGEPFRKIPTQYLVWLVRNGVQRMIKMPHGGGALAVCYLARVEIDRRAQIVPRALVSPKVIDKLSLEFFNVWRNTNDENEGLHAWALRQTRQAELDVLEELENFETIAPQVYEVVLGGLIWTIKMEDDITSLEDISF